MPFHTIDITPHSLIGLFNFKSKAIKVGGLQNPEEVRQMGISLAAHCSLTRALPMRKNSLH